MSTILALLVPALVVMGPGAAWAQEEGPRVLEPGAEVSAEASTVGTLFVGHAAEAEKAGFPYAALVLYGTAISTDPLAAGKSAGDALRLAEQVGDLTLLEPIFGKNVGLDVDPTTRGRMALLAARYAHAQDSHAVAVGLLKMVAPDSPAYAEAKALEGVVLSHTGRYPEAIAAFQVAMAAGVKRPDAERWVTVMNLDVARAYYGAGDFVRAIEYFAKVPRSSPWWSQAQFERAWAHFRLDDLNGTLGLLSTHSSAWYADRYFPEAAMLEVYSLFLLCKFPAAGKGIDAFASRFTPMQAELAKVGSLTPAQAFESIASKQGAGLPPMVADLFLGEARFQRAAGAAKALDAELARLGSASGPWAESARSLLSARKNELVQAEGGRVLARARAMEEELSTMLASIEMNKLDILQMESRMYERAANTGAMEKAKATVDRAVRVREGYRHWPYEGEGWADEIGWLRVDTKAECPESLRTGR